MKKLSVAILAVVCAITCMAFTACGSSDPGYNETFDGYVSEQSYDTVEDAAKAFLEVELSGATSNTTFVEYKTSASLSQEEIDGLPIDDSEKAKVTAAEKGNIAYTETRKSSTKASVASSSNIKSKEIYILHEGNVFKYYVPAMVVGGEITKSYYDYVFDSSKYVNFTASGKQTVQIKTTVNGYKINQTVDTSYTYKITEDAAYIVSSASGLKAEVLIVNTQSGVKKLANISGSSIYSYILTDGWEPLENTYLAFSYGYIDSIDEFVSQINYDFFDQTYFVKTDSGFACREDRFSEMCKIMFAQMFDESSFEDISSDMSMIFDSISEANINFFVRDGKIADCSGKIVIDLDYSYGGNSMTLYEASSFKYSYSNFGTTTIDIPSEAQAYL